MNAEEVKAKARELVQRHHILSLGMSVHTDTDDYRDSQRQFEYLCVQDGVEIAQADLDAIAVLEKIAEAEIPSHGSMDSWAINMARDFLEGVRE